MIGQGKLVTLQYPIWIMLVVIVVGEILLRRARFFRQSYFIGGNERSARLSGINVDRVKILNYMLMGAAGRPRRPPADGRAMGTASVSAGQGTDLAVISACVIGGSSLAGGEGSVLGSLLGVILMALIFNGLNLLGVNPYWQTIVIGAVLDPDRGGRCAEPPAGARQSENGSGCHEGGDRAQSKLAVALVEWTDSDRYLVQGGVFSCNVDLLVVLCS